MLNNLIPVAVCLREEQAAVCAMFGVSLVKNYAASWGGVTAGCVTDFSVHCYNSDTLKLLASLGVARATLHLELNLAQMRDLIKAAALPMQIEAVIYGKLPLMNLAVAPASGEYISDRKGARFFLHKEKNANSDIVLYNSVPIYTADKQDEIAKAKITHGRFIFTDETAKQTRMILEAYKKQLPPEKIFPPSGYTRGKFFSKVL
jgi:hypothetical protein